MAQENCCNLENCIKVGPWGSQGGRPWSFKPKGLISEIIISHGRLIDSISFKSEDGTENTTIEYSNKFGGDGGKTEKISLDTPREYLMSITGTHDTFNHIVQSLYFYTNRTKYGPFGSSKLGTSFNLPMEGGVIVGFHGRSGALLDAIGVYMKCAADVLPLSCSRQGQMATNKVNNVVMNVEASREAGPWGGNKGKSWDDGVFNGVEQVNVHVGNGIVHAVQFFYGSRDGKSVWSKVHGTGDGGSLKRIKLDRSSEYLVGMMGFYGPIKENGGFEAIRSVSFYTNKGKYGPFGTEIGTAFGSSASDGKIVGFHGKSGAYLDAIGVHVEYF